MAETFQGLISSKLKVIRNTHRDDTKFNTAIGEDFGKMTYPAVQIIPTNTVYQNDLEYLTSFNVRYVFEKDPTNIDIVEAIEDVEEATDTVLTKLKTDTDSKEFKPQSFDYFVAENSGNRLTVVEVSWELTNLQDFTG